MPIGRYQATSALARPGVIPNAAARPASPYEGQVVYQTDTDGLFVWNGLAWTPPWNTAWGVVFHTASTASTAFSAATPLSVLSGTVSIVAGRRYLISARVGVQVTGAAAAGNALYVNESTLGNKTISYDTFAIQQFYCKYFGDSVLTQASDFGVTSGTASKTLTLYWRCGASGALNSNPDAIVGASSLPHQLTVEDVGPA